MSDTDLAYLPATEIRSMIAEKQVSSVEMTKLYLDRIDSLDSQFNSYLTVTSDLALEMAAKADRAVARGDDLGPLHGLPISIKDLEMTEGIRTTSGSLIFADRIAAYDSVVVERVKKAGAVILGKTNTPEYGLLGHTENRLGDHCRNPWNTERTTGGSSGGAGASVAAGLCALATGSDGGGSIRIPAGFCGIYGIKPTQGRISYYLGPGADPASNLFSQPGPMTRTVADSALLLQVLAGRDPRDPGALRDEPDDYVAALSKGVEGMRIGWSADFGFAAVEPEVRDSAAAAARAFEDLGCVVEEIDVVLNSPFEQFWPLFTAIMYARVAGVVDEHWDKLSWYAQESLETGTKHNRSRVCQRARPCRRDEVAVRRRVRQVRPHSHTDPCDARLPRRGPPSHDRRAGCPLVLGLHALHHAHQYDWLYRREHPVRVLFRRPAHRIARHRPGGWGGDRLRRLSRFRGGPPVDPAPSAGGVKGGLTDLVMPKGRRESHP